MDSSEASQKGIKCNYTCILLSFRNHIFLLNSPTWTQEQFDSAEFNIEVEILSKIEHRNLVKLLGFVDKGDERLIVTEYVPNGTLREHLDGKIKTTVGYLKM